MNEIDPLLRGIYYMYLNDVPPEYINDVRATYEMFRVWLLCDRRFNVNGNQICSLSLIHKNREVFVRELVRKANV